VYNSWRVPAKCDGFGVVQNSSPSRVSALSTLEERPTSPCERLTERKGLECEILMDQEADKSKARETTNVI